MTNQNSGWQSLINRPIKSVENTLAPSYITFIDCQAVLEVNGSDAIKFLQGQCSADIEKLAESESVPGSICTVKGRVLTTFIATKTDTGILLRMPTELIPNIKTYLAKYAAFYKVELIEWPSPCVVSTKEYTLKHNSPELIKMNYSLNENNFTEYLIHNNQLDSVLTELSELEKEGPGFYSEAVWQDQQIDAGWLNLTNETSETFLPHQLNLEKLGAINFKKGCYTGQEIIARTEYRGKPKRRLHRVKIKGLNQTESLRLPADIHDRESGKSIGTLLALGAKANYCLAILSVENSGKLDSIINDQDYEISSSTEINVF